MNKRLELPLDSVPQHWNHSLWNCQRARVCEKRVYCKSGFDIATTYEQAESGDYLLRPICQECADFTPFDNQMPIVEIGWDGSREGAANHFRRKPMP